MLVLTRRVGEKIVIDDQIRLTVIAVHGKRVRLGVSAPTSVRIVRQEIYEPQEMAPSPESPQDDAVETPLDP